jgi:hypothetical protein
VVDSDIVAITPVMPRSADLDPAKVAFNYDRESDTLMIHLYGEPQPAISVAGSDEYLYWRVTPDTHQVIGMQYEHFLSHLVYERPEFLDFADLAGIPADEIESIRSRIHPDQRRRAAVEYLLVQSDVLLHQDGG